MSTTKPQIGEFWDRITDPILLYVQRVRIHAAPTPDGWVEVQTERASGKLGKVRRERLAKFGRGGPLDFYKATP